MDGINRTNGMRQTGNSAPSKTVSLQILRSGIDLLTRTLKDCRTSGNILLRFTPHEVNILPPSEKQSANVVLTITEFRHLISNLPSAVGQNIMIVRGYSSIFMVTDVFKDQFDLSLEKYLEDIVLESNRNLINSIFTEVCSPRLIARNFENANAFQETYNWAAVNDPHGNVIRFLENGNMLIRELPNADFEMLRKQLDRLASDFKREKVMAKVSTPVQTDVSPYAHTAYQSKIEPFGDAITVYNISNILRGSLEADPQQTLFFQIDPGNGMLQQTKNENDANLALAFDCFLLDIADMPLAKRNIMLRFNISPTLRLVNRVYLDNALGNALPFFLDTVNRVNSILGNIMLENIKLKAEEYQREIKDEHLAALKSQISVIFQGIQPFVWAKT